jgi:hypothetical protein
MKYIVLIYNDPKLLGAMPKEEFNSTMRDCLSHADEMVRKGSLLESQMLEDPSTARSVRIRGGKRMVTDGPFIETKEFLGGFNIIEADNMEEAEKLADNFPWASVGCVEIRPIRDIGGVRKAVGVG